MDKLMEEIYSKIRNNCRNKISLSVFDVSCKLKPIYFKDAPNKIKRHKNCSKRCCLLVREVIQAFQKHISANYISKAKVREGAEKAADKIDNWTSGCSQIKGACLQDKEARTIILEAMGIEGK